MPLECIKLTSIVFLSAIEREFLLYRNKWSSEEREKRAFLVLAIKHFCKKHELPWRFSQSDVNEKVRAAAKDL